MGCRRATCTAPPGSGQPLTVIVFMTGLATTVGCLFLIPQIVRLVRRRDVSGVSPSAAALGVVQTLSWATYGIGTGAWAVVISSAVAAPQYAAVFLFTTRRRSGRRRATGQAALSLSGVAAASAFTTWSGKGPWPGLGAALTVAVIWQYVPAVLAAFGPNGAAGLSVTTWLLIGGNGSVWTVYGVIIGAAAVIAYGLVLDVAAAAVLFAIWRHNHWPRPSTG
jgi:uncharacterized protein with PQ loop repeat